MAGRTHQTPFEGSWLPYFGCPNRRQGRRRDVPPRRREATGVVEWNLALRILSGAVLVGVAVVKAVAPSLTENELGATAAVAGT